jgi:iron complex transport system permease protein
MSASADTRTIPLAQPSIAQRRLTICGILALCLLTSVIFSAAHGPANIPYGDVARLLLRGLNLPVGLDLPDSDLAIVNAIRLPRILIGALVGAALACSGATMQGVFRNPLADPGLLGISAGSGLAAVIAITSGAAIGSLWILPGAAFAGAMAASILVYGLSLTRGRSDPSTLLLAGMAVSSLLGALTTAVLLSTKDYAAIQEALSWLFGGLQGRGWDHLRVAALPILSAILVTFAYGRDLNLMLNGEEVAQSLGVNVPRSRLVLLTLVAVMTGAAVSVAGGIGFVGLMIPHALRLVVGPDHRILLPASALGGAVFLTLADTAARLTLQPAELQVGVLTALLGAPFFLFLLWRQRQQITV